MTVYVDTSAIYAVMDADDSQHEVAKNTWANLLESGDGLVCNSYVLLETYALVQHRLGIEAVRVLHDEILPVITVDWVDETIHKEAAAALLIAGRKDLSLVDCSSFVTMRRLGLRRAFALDHRFREQGFGIL
ncbi:MAG: PIN domain-containing protein [Firmicutes bacterium]|jgi:predicted nucleic acid-binding protein|nr:PIN domain-containing protein [Candidatus Fermentithermobacillaceae bacterium]